MSKLRQIEQENKDIERQKIEMIDFWLSNSEPSNCSWGKLAEALKLLGGHSRLVSRLNGSKLENKCLPEAESKQSGIYILNGLCTIWPEVFNRLVTGIMHACFT
jgi:hypothetical protein